MSDQPTRKSRSYSWVPLEENGTPTAKCSGLQYFQALKAKALPQQPITATIGWQVAEVEEGCVSLSLDCEEHLLHAGGYMHGGVLATLLDSAMAAAMMTTAPQGARCSTLQLSVQYLATVRKDVGRLIAEGKLSHRGRRVCAAEGLVRDEQNKVYARATATLLMTEETARAKSE